MTLSDGVNMCYVEILFLQMSFWKSHPTALTLVRVSQSRGSHLGFSLFKKKHDKKRKRRNENSSIKMSMMYLLNICPFMNRFKLYF